MEREHEYKMGASMSPKVNMNRVSDGATWHAMSQAEVVERLATDPEKGLSLAEASARLQKYGPNRLLEGRKRSPFARFFAQFNNILIYVLLAAGFTKLMLSLWVDAGIIFAVVVLNALLGFIQEGKAGRALDSIRNMFSAEARTMRCGETRMIPAEQLVPGDVVLLESGDKIPADLRLIEAKNLRTEEAALTGESVPAEKTVDRVPVNATVGDRGSMAFSGTMVVTGRATGVVVATGNETELGRINRLLAEVSPLETPLLRHIKKFGYTITAVIAVVSVLIFAYGKWVRGMDFVSTRSPWEASLSASFVKRSRSSGAACPSAVCSRLQCSRITSGAPLTSSTCLPSDLCNVAMNLCSDSKGMASIRGNAACSACRSIPSLIANG